MDNVHGAVYAVACLDEKCPIGFKDHGKWPTKKEAIKAWSTRSNVTSAERKAARDKLLTAQATNKRVRGYFVIDGETEATILNALSQPVYEEVFFETKDDFAGGFSRGFNHLLDLISHKGCKIVKVRDE